MIDQDLIYFDLNYDEFNDSKYTIETIYTTLTLITCRCYQSSFSLNNSLYKDVCVKNCSNQSIIFKKVIFELLVYNITTIRSKINTNKDIEFEFELRKWQFVFVSITLNKNEKSDFVCLNIKVEVILFDTDYFKTQN